MRKVLLSLCLPLACLCQNTIGFPDVINYSKQQYNAGLQNWDINQDKNGIIYAANNEGLLSFDGKNWKIYPLPNKTIVRSIGIGSDNRIYVGGQDEIGYFVPKPNGELGYHSLTNLIPMKDRSFEDVWDIVFYKKSAFFRTPSKIFQFNNETILTHKSSSEWVFLGLFRNQLCAQDSRNGLVLFDNNRWIPLPINNQPFKNDNVTGIIETGNDSTVITTLKSGLFTVVKDQLVKVLSPSSGTFENDRIYAAAKVSRQWIALATSNSGVYIVDLKGNIIQHISRKEGLQNNNVLSIFLDKQQNLWLGLDNGLDFIAYNSAIKYISPQLNDESGYTALIYRNQLYMGTSGNLYHVPLQPLKDLSFSKGNFMTVENTKGQSWNLTVINNNLLLGHHEGAFLIKNHIATAITRKPGFWNFIPFSSNFPVSEIVSGNYKGLTFFNYKNELFLPFPGPAEFNESSRFIAIDTDNNIWISHPYHGIYKIQKTASGAYIYTDYTTKKGLPATLNNHIFTIRNELLVATEKGIFRFNSLKEQFEKSTFYNTLLGNQSIRYLKEDNEGNVWFVHEKNLGVIDLSQQEPAVIYLPELNGKMLSGFEFIYAVDQQNIFLGGENGFYHINYDKYKKDKPQLNVLIRSVNLVNASDSILFGGYSSNINDSQQQIENNIPSVSYNWKTIQFSYAAPLFGNTNNLEYSFRMAGFSKEWSAWTKRTEKEYTNLQPGNYRFEVKVRNNLGNESPVTSYSLKILPPWYKSIWVYMVYLILFFSGVYTLYKWQQKKFISQQIRHKKEQQKLLYIHDLEISKSSSELVTLRNEKLEADLNFKNTELASSAMHIVKKSELLTRIKSELAQIIKKIDNEYTISELKKMIKALSEDDNMDKEWDYFTKHFDKVHSDFIQKLKIKHPAISNNDLKLCAYLRINLTSKEIAQLLNISLRGVEISRYRLRKKLGIQSEVNLFDYLLNIGNNT